MMADNDPLMGLVGNWGVGEVAGLAPGGQALRDTQTDNLRMEGDLTAGGNVLLLKAGGNIRAQGLDASYSGAGMLSFDAAQNTYTEMWNDNLGKAAVLTTDQYEVRDAGRTLRLTHQIDGKTYVSEYKTLSAGEFKYSLFDTTDGSSTTVKSTVFKRQ